MSIPIHVDAPNSRILGIEAKMRLANPMAVVTQASMTVFDIRVIDSLKPTTRPFDTLPSR